MAANSDVSNGILQNSNSSKLLSLVSLHARTKKNQPKMKAQEWSQHSSHYKSMGIFQNLRGTTILVRILPNFENIQELIVVLVTCKNKEEPIK